MERFIEPCFGIGHSLSLICQLTSEDIKHQLIIILTSTETTRPVRDGEKKDKGVWRWGEREILYLSGNVTTRMTPTLRWAAMRAILMFHNCEGHRKGR